MNKKEVAELKRRYKKDQATFSRLVGCYVDGGKNKVCRFGGKFLTLEEEEYYKYLEIAGKILSGTLGNNLLDLNFPLAEEAVGGRQQILMALRDSGLEDEALLDAWFDLVIKSYNEPGNYLILLYLDSYDVMTRTKDNKNLDESEEVFTYLLAAICPVALSKPGLSFLEDEQRIGPRIRDWVVSVPDTGFLFPAFNDRSTDIHSVLFYTKNTKEPHAEFMADGLGCGIKHTATEQKQAFHSVLKNSLGADKEDTEDIILDLEQTLQSMSEEYKAEHEKDAEPLLLDENTLSAALADSRVPEEKTDKIKKNLAETFGEELPSADTVIDQRALAAGEVRIEKMQLEDRVSELCEKVSEQEKELTLKSAELLEKQEALDSYTAEAKTADIILRVKPEKADRIKSAVIDGQKCLVVPLDENENAIVNGLVVKA